MAYIYKKTYEVMQRQICQTSKEDYIEADDLIALPVARMMQKGYPVIDSGAGHPFHSVMYLDTDVDLNTPVDFDDMAKSVKNTSENKALFVLRTYRERMSYIMFDDDFEGLDTLPEGWAYDETIKMLYTRYAKNTDPYAFTMSQVENMRSLLKWVEEEI